MENEQDIVVFIDDEGNEVTMEVLDYFFYEGDEYAVLTELTEDAGSEDHNMTEAYMMKVVPVGEDEEEFIPIEDEQLAKTLIELYQSEDIEDDMDDEEE